MSCGTITKGITTSCSTKPVGGLEVDIYMANRADIASVTKNVTNDLIVEGITMVATKKFYKFSGLKQSNKASAKMFKGPYFNSWDHGADLIIFSNTADTKANIIEQLANGDVVLVINNKWKGTNGEQALEMLGYEVGLTGVTVERVSDDADTQGAWKVTLGPPDGEHEPRTPLTIFDTNYADSLAVVTALL